MKKHVNRQHQTGATLMETLVAMSISLVVTAAMVALMANSLGSTTRIIKMTKLSDDMRVALQMMTRDVRRSNYNANSMFCYSNENCEDDGVVSMAGPITFSDTNDCMIFQLDRTFDGFTNEEDAVGGFRRITNDDDVGVIQMWTGDTSPGCSDDVTAAGWVEITNPENMDIFAFTVDDDLSYDQVIKDDGATTVTQRVRKIRMNLRGRLVMDNDIERRMEDIISVRNDLLL